MKIAAGQSAPLLLILSALLSAKASFTPKVSLYIRQSCFLLEYEKNMGLSHGTDSYTAISCVDSYTAISCVVKPEDSA